MKSANVSTAIALSGPESPQRPKPSSSIGTNSPAKGARLIGQVASVLLQGNTPGLDARLVQVPMLTEPVIREQPTKHRELDEVDVRLRETIRGLVMGKLPWPLFLHSPAGVGKTCMMLCFADRIGTYSWWALSGLCHALHESMGKGYIDHYDLKRSRWDIWTEWRNATVGFIDEIGLRREPSDAHYENLGIALDARDDMPSVYASNLDLEQLERIYDDRISSRLSKGIVVELTGPDRRCE